MARQAKLDRLDENQCQRSLRCIGVVSRACAASCALTHHSRRRGGQLFGQNIFRKSEGSSRQVPTKSFCSAAIGATTPPGDLAPRRPRPGAPNAAPSAARPAAPPAMAPLLRALQQLALWTTFTALRLLLRAWVWPRLTPAVAEMAEGAMEDILGGGRRPTCAVLRDGELRDGEAEDDAWRRCIWYRSKYWLLIGWSYCRDVKS